MYTLFFAKFIMAFAAMNYAISKMHNVDLISMITRNETALYAIYTTILIVAVFHLVQRDYYLPFLGPTVIPIKESETVGKLIDVKLTGLPANTRVLYWAANESENTFNNPLEAYRGYGNSGLTKTNEKGDVVIRMNCPSDYYVSKFGFNKHLQRHVHYRVESSRFPGLFSSVRTKYVDC
jgi:hypothetical protein